MSKTICITTFLVFLCSFAFGQSTSVKREYKLGEKYRYQLVCTEFHNNNWKSTIISICELTVVKDENGFFHDEVRWISKKILTPKDTTEQNAKASAVKPYRISLQLNGNLDLPKIEVPEMTQPMQDFNTFFVAVSPHLGTTELKSIGDSILKKEVIKADFSNGDFILKGEDCFTVKMKMTDVTRNAVMTRVDFMSPSEVCFPYLLEEMSTPVINNTINNFQMVMPAGTDKYNVQYGKEMFYITSATSRKDGKILQANMSNLLNLKLKVNCDKNYKNCQLELPFTLKRELTLELMTN